VAALRAPFCRRFCDEAEGLAPGDGRGVVFWKAREAPCNAARYDLSSREGELGMCRLEAGEPGRLFMGPNWAKARRAVSDLYQWDHRHMTFQGNR
jgi:hypothetical protein